MTFLQLCQRLRLETAYTDTGPSAVTSQTGTHLRNVQWVADAYTQLQNRHPWRWLRKEFSLTLSSGTEEYAYTSATDIETASSITRFKSWRVNDPYERPTCYLNSDGEGAEYFLNYIPWETFKTIYRLGTVANAKPVHFSIAPDDALVFGPTPDDTYVMKSEYHRSAQVLAADGDTPEMPSDYHMLIVYMAMEDAGYFEDAPDILQRSRVKGRRMLRQLEMNQLPRIRISGPMA